jgi:hypothetical protein
MDVAETEPLALFAQSVQVVQTVETYGLVTGINTWRASLVKSTLLRVELPLAPKCVLQPRAFRTNFLFS